MELLDGPFDLRRTRDAGASTTSRRRSTSTPASRHPPGQWHRRIDARVRGRVRLQGAAVRRVDSRSASDRQWSHGPAESELFTAATLVSSTAGHLKSRKTQHLSQYEHRALTRRQVLNGRDEGELEALSRFIASLGEWRSSTRRSDTARSTRRRRVGSPGVSPTAAGYPTLIGSSRRFRSSRDRR